MHPSRETLLLYALGHPLDAGIERSLAAHAGGCPLCGERLDLLLESRFAVHEAASSATGRADRGRRKTRAAEPRRPESRPLRAAAAATPKLEVPPAPALVGSLRFGERRVGVFRRKDSEVFVLDEAVLAGKAVRIRFEGEALDAAVDAFRRFRIPEAPAEKLVEWLKDGRAAIEIVP